jgi:AcrR family transcriptional regulator
MSPRTARTQPENGVRQKGRKSTQRERLLAGMVTTANRDGYAGANVSKIIAEAGVSRPTFYDYFTDKDDCFLGALGDIQERLLAEIRQAVAGQPPEQALQASLSALVEFASAEPEPALFLMSQAMAAGPRALDARDRGIAEIEGVIEEAHGQLPPTAVIPDLSPGIAIGGVYRLLASRLRRGEPGLSRVSDDLSTWVESYERPVGEQRWRTLRPIDAGAPPPGLALGPLPAPSPLPPGRPGLSKEDVAANHRARILYAAAQLAEKKGYNASTIADITRMAGVDGRAFYAAFADKQDAFMAVHELGAQQVMSATAGAFFTGASWPERMWEAGRAFAGFLQSNPMIAQVGFVEAYAVGPGAVQRVEDSHVTFTIFLQEGYQQKPRRTPPSRLALEAIITSIFEIVYREVRRSKDPQVTGMLGHMAFLSLAPFLGASEASRFIAETLQG